MLITRRFISWGKGERGFGVGEGSIVGVERESGSAAGEEEVCCIDGRASEFECLVVALRPRSVSWVCILKERDCRSIPVRVSR